MWATPGTAESVDHWQPFAPTEMLYEFDGPKTFVHRNKQGDLFLAHWCDEDEHSVRFIVAPTSEDCVEQLKQGQLTLRQALDQSFVWVLDLNHEDSVIACSRSNIADLPDEVLPQHGILLFTR